MAVLGSNILPVLTSKSQPPPLFDGTPRLYVSLSCPYAQRVYTARNYKRLNEIQIVPINLQDRPAWYKEKVYPANKVPALEHNGKVIGESLDLLKYVDENFGGPKLIPSDSEKQKAVDEFIQYIDTFNKTGFSILKSPDVDIENELAPVLNHLGNALQNFEDGPFFLGQFSIVDCAYAPFLERFQTAYKEFRNYDILSGRPELSNYFEELDKVDAYAVTKVKPEETVAIFKRLFNL